MKQRREIARISVATYAEVIRNYEDKPEAEKAEALVDELNPPLQLTQQHARRWARMQNRSNRVMGDNDAWNAALAISANAKLIGSDKAFDNRPDLDYYDYMK